MEDVAEENLDRSRLAPVRARGRKRSTSAAELESAGFALFEARGFEATTVEDIAAEVGIAKRTFFHYFESKNDLVWGDFEAHLQTMRAGFAARPRDEPIMESVRMVVVEFNRFGAAQLPRHRKRMELILKVPALQANSTLRYHNWRVIVAEFVAGRRVEPPTALIPRAVAYAALGVAWAAYEQWLDAPHDSLTEYLDTAFSELSEGFSAVANHPE
ncbi:mycofactocin system transcriptional regulator [Nocardia sp. NPDC004860]|uniref:mycofactocin system transcriptional regulator n=1 Tax=Nocardia sp. NPDC004860 TaxID=3154557 RepID=UPI0033B382C3